MTVSEYREEVRKVLEDSGVRKAEVWVRLCPPLDRTFVIVSGEAERAGGRDEPFMIRHELGTNFRRHTPERQALLVAQHTLRLLRARGYSVKADDGPFAPWPRRPLAARRRKEVRNETETESRTLCAILVPRRHYRIRIRIRIFGTDDNDSMGILGCRRRIYRSNDIRCV